MYYIVASAVRKKAKSMGKRVSKSFLVALDLKIDKIIERAVKDNHAYKTLTNEDLM